MKKNYLSGIEKLKSFFSKLNSSSKITFWIVGIASTLWFIVRVIPKPQRAGYPCMRAAAPIMSGFVLYLLSLGGITLMFRKAVAKFRKAQYLSAVFALVISFVLLIAFNWNSAQKVYSQTVGFTRGVLPDGANNPMGEGIGVNPGRVVWAWDPDATNKSCKNVISDAFFMPKNNDQEVINAMMNSSIIHLAGTNTVEEAWDAIFKDFNERKTGTATGFQDGQTVFIKVNNGQAGWAINLSDLSETGTTSEMTGTQNCAMSGTTPASVLALIRQLVDECAIPQTSIYVGEPMTHVYKSMYDAIHGEYPGVIILDKDGYTNLGRTKSTGWTNDVIFYSDKGEIMQDAIKDNMMQEMYDADYLINAAALKAHARAGVTFNAKLHFGTHGNHSNFGYSSFHLHAGLICTVDNDVTTSGYRSAYGMYRVLVDIMGHEKLGRNTVLFLVDGLWGGVEATDMPVKWNMDPFSGDFPSSLFLSQDGVAIESVCLDFLRAEADQNEYFNDRPFFGGVDDHLHQAADKSNWPANITYDPENDGSEIPSLGVHEHWNNSTDMQYTRNLGTGNGIELLKLPKKNIQIPGTITVENSELPSNQVNTLYIDSSLAVWIGTDSGLSRLTEEGWKHYDTILLNKTVNDLAYEHTSYGRELWIATDSGLTVSAFNDIDGVTGSTTYTPENSEMIGHKVSSLSVDVLHNRWIGTDSALCVFSGSTWDFTLSGLDAGENEYYFYDNIITDIEAYDKDSLALVATNGKGIARMQYDHVDGFTGASTYGQPWASIFTDSITAIDVDEELQWYGTNSGTHKHMTNLTKDNWPLFNVDSGLVSNSVKTVHIDNSRYAWIGTNAGISIVLTDGGMYELTENEGLINNEVNYITGDIIGNVWIATSGGLQWFEGLSGIQTKLGMPALNSPENYATEVDPSTTLQWSYVSGAESYNLLVATDRNFTNVILNETGITSTSYQLSGLSSETDYFWKVSASSSSLNGYFTAYYQFTTKLNTSTNNHLAVRDHILMYPNPAEDMVNITIDPENEQKISVKIYSLNGKMINSPIHINAGSSEQTITIDISDKSIYPGGIYILWIKGETFSQVLKLIID